MLLAQSLRESRKMSRLKSFILFTSGLAGCRSMSRSIPQQIVYSEARLLNSSPNVAHPDRWQFDFLDFAVSIVVKTETKLLGMIKKDIAARWRKVDGYATLWTSARKNAESSIGKVAIYSYISGWELPSDFPLQN